MSLLQHNVMRTFNNAIIDLFKNKDKAKMILNLILLFFISKYTLIYFLRNIICIFFKYLLDIFKNYYFCKIISLNLCL